MRPTADQLLRSVTFRPYAKGMGPMFHLTLWDTYQQSYGKSLLGYRLSMSAGRGRRAVLFEGTDFGCPPQLAIDSDACVAGVMAFLTLRPGDTDREYFADYSPRQLAYCSAHAETLAADVAARFPY